MPYESICPLGVCLVLSSLLGGINFSFALNLPNMTTTTKVQNYFTVTKNNGEKKQSKLRKSVLCRATICWHYSCKCTFICLAHLDTGIFGAFFVIKLPHIPKSGLWQGHTMTFKCFSLNHSTIAKAPCLGSLSCGKFSTVSNLWPTEKGSSQELPHPHFFNPDQFPDKRNALGIMQPPPCCTVEKEFTVLGLHHT